MRKSPDFSRKSSGPIIIIGMMLILVGLDFSALENSNGLLVLAGALMSAQGVYNGFAKKKETDQ